MHSVPIYRVQLVKVGHVDFEHIIIRSPQNVINAVEWFLRDQFGGEMPDREVFGALWLNAKNKITGLEFISIGSLNASIVAPRESFKGAFIHNACSVVFFHNHPSGNPSPSMEDINVTKRLAEVGQIIGIDVLDSIILGEDGQYFSMKENGYI